MPHTPTILCLSSTHKGGRFLEAAERAGARVLLITTEKHRHDAWPHEALSGFYVMPSLLDRRSVTNAIGYLARTEDIDRIVALDEYDTLMVAHMREHLGVSGVGTSDARLFRDKLAMRVAAREAGIPVPDFVGFFNRREVAAFAERNAPPYVLKPRMEASAMGIRKLGGVDELTPLFDELGDAHGDYLVESFVSGQVYHVDSVVQGGAVSFASASAYETPPMRVYQGGGVFATRTLGADEAPRAEILAMNAEVARAFGLRDGVCHAEFIRAEDGTIHFLEAAARVGGAGIADLVEAARGLNLWDAWALVEVAQASGAQLTMSDFREDHAGLLVCLAREEHPDLSAYAAPEVVWRMEKPYHAGLIISSPDAHRVRDLLSDYAAGFERDFLAISPPKERADL